MRRLLAGALFLAGVVLPLRVEAQIASVTSGPLIPDAVELARGSAPIPRLPDMTRAWTMPVGPASRLFPGPSRPFRPRPRFGFGHPFGPRFSFSAVFWSPWLYPYWWDSPWDSNSDQNQQAQAPEPEADRSLRRQMGRLTREITKLRYYEEFSGRAAPVAAAAVRPSAPPSAPVARRMPPTVFVYRDGRQFEVTDYAIFGSNLWIFGNSTSRKIPLAALNLPASQKLNEERGIGFDRPD